MTDLYIPLQFWFNRNTSLSLPSVSIGYYECSTDLINNDDTLDDIHLFNPDCDCDKCSNMRLVIEI